MAKSSQSIPLLPLQCIAIVGLPESAKLRLIAQGGTRSTRRQEKPSFWSEQDLFVGAMTKHSEISVKHFEQLEQSGIGINLDKQVLRPRNSLHWGRFAWTLANHQTNWLWPLLTGGYVYIYHSTERPYAWKQEDGYTWSEILHQVRVHLQFISVKVANFDLDEGLFPKTKQLRMHDSILF